MKLSHVAKRSLLLKEHEFLKVKPLSNEMKSFISKYKRKAEDNIGGDTRYEDEKSNQNERDEDEKSPNQEEIVSVPAPQTTLTTSVATMMPNTPYTKKQNDAAFLNKVLQDVQELVKYEKEGKSLSNEGSLCNVMGDWDSDAGGMQLRIDAGNNTSRTPDIKLVEREPQVEGGFLCDGRWNITGHLPFNHSSVMILIAVSNRRKRVATFIGECRICEGTETITGDWMVGRGSRNCKDRQESHTFFSDVLRKNNIRPLQKAHLKEITPTSTTTS
ncbi:hypothetical protein NQ314_009498 [Rhamnusium bicolor]|uniref:Uncharacterized protein n=1 Tax=Rhamnusium bicolor TaxID=1586634 RepID=A0AAV8XZZ6_9CUCU|nr:hypothetical protein NQ314_009498 [Rhamnusium bicolor]